MQRHITIRLNHADHMALSKLGGIDGVSEARQTLVTTSIKATITGDDETALNAIEAKIKTKFDVDEIVLTMF